MPVKTLSQPTGRRMHWGGQPRRYDVLCRFNVFQCLVARRRSWQRVPALRAPRGEEVGVVAEVVVLGDFLHLQQLFRKEWETEPNWPKRTKPNRWIPEPAGSGRGNEPNRTGPSHNVRKAQEEHVEPGKLCFRTEPSRTDELSKSKSLEPKQIEPDRFLPGYIYIYICVMHQ